MKRALVLAALSLAAPAMAQTPTPSKTAADAKYAPPTQYVNYGEGDTVEGEFPRPDEILVRAGQRAKHQSLIKLRYAFLDEMIKSAEDL